MSRLLGCLVLGLGLLGCSSSSVSSVPGTPAPAPPAPPPAATTTEPASTVSASGEANAASEPAVTAPDKSKSDTAEVKTGAYGVDPAFPDYQPVQGVSGNLKSIGSDTMNNLMTFWAEGFKSFYPNVKIEIEGKGSGTAPTALIAGTAQFGPMSRPMKQKEIDDFKAKFGHEPIAIGASLDMLAVFVNKDNPIKGLTLAQVDAIFSKTRKGGYTSDIQNWGQVGLTGEWANRSMEIYGRNSASGTYGFFKEHVLKSGDFKDEVKEQPGSSSVVTGVGGNKFAIGYSGIGYRTPDVRALALAPSDGEEYCEAVAENAYSGEYPLSRLLYVYVNHEPGTEMEPLRREFLKYVFSKQGQQDVIKDGYLPVTAEIAREQLRLIGVEPTF